MLVTQTCNHTYLGVRDQENHGAKTFPGKCYQNTILKKTHHKKCGGVTQVVRAPTW
jgi:hypothetical protein